MAEFEAGSNRQDRLDPEIRAFQRAINTAYAENAGHGDGGVKARREIAERVRAPWTEGGPSMAATRETTVPSGVRIRIYTPAHADPQGVLVYLHGGGWVLFSLDTHDRLMREYAARSCFTVVGVDYSLAPEAPYPQALDDVRAVVEWIVDRGLGEGALSDGSLSADGGVPKIVLGGDSAGANLAIAAAMRARDNCERIPDGLLLNYGAFDRRERPSHALYDGDEYMLTRDEMAAFWGAYLGATDEEDARYAQPLRLNAARMPATFMCIAECDVLFDENREMARRLRAAGVDVTEKVYEGAAHSFLEAMSISAVAREALDDAARWLAERT